MEETLSLDELHNNNAITSISFVSEERNKEIWVFEQILALQYFLNVDIDINARCAGKKTITNLVAALAVSTNGTNVKVIIRASLCWNGFENIVFISVKICLYCAFHSVDNNGYLSDKSVNKYLAPSCRRITYFPKCFEVASLLY